MKRLCTRLIALAAVAALSGACDDDTGTGPTVIVIPPTTSEFTSSLLVNGATSRSFTAIQTGTMDVTLQAAGPPGTTVGLAVGVPYGSGIANCTVTKTINTTAGSTPQLSLTVDPGRYCVAIYDTGSLTADINFRIVIVYP